MLGKEQPAQSSEFRRGEQVDIFLALGIAEYQMGMHIDQTGHDEMLAGIDKLVPRQHGGSSGGWADIAQYALLNHQALLHQRHLVKPGKQRSATNMDTRHGIPLLWCLSGSSVPPE